MVALLLYFVCYVHGYMKSYPQSGLDDSNRAAGLAKIKWLPQTCSVEFFSTSWDGVKSLQFILDNHISCLCRDNFCEVSSVFTMLGRQKNPSYCALQRFFAQPTTSQDETMTFNLKKINPIGTWNKFSEFASFRSVGLSVSLVTPAWASRSLDEQILP